MWLDKAAKFIGRISDPAAKITNYAGAVVLASMMLLTGSDVTLRYVFNKPIPGSYEVTEFLMSIVVALGLAYCAMEKGHVRVDLVISRLSDRTQAVMNFIASLVFLIMFILITWQSVYRAQAMIQANLTSHVLYIPSFPFVFVLTFGSAILCFVLLRDTLDYLFQVVKK